MLPQATASRTTGIPFLIWAMLLTGMAGALGWGIRGQFGHETGAMIAGVLTASTLILLFVPRGRLLIVARALALMTIGIGIGGSMTYGQTVGLTHDAPMIGNWPALRWGLLGLAVKGGIWIGFAGIFLGIGLGGRRYRPGEMALVFAALLGLMVCGAWLFNSPFAPDQRVLPRIYFSADWRLRPGEDLQPRREVWGGLLLAWLGLLAYTRVAKQDRLAARLAGWGFLAGALGFPGGQCVQAFHAWNPTVFETGALGSFAEYFRHFNWWNMMETTFGAIFGAVLALGVWLNQRLISVEEPPPEVRLSSSCEWAMIISHLTLLLSAEFLELPTWGAWLALYTDLGLLLAALPVMGVTGGRHWPYWTVSVIVAAPILGKMLGHVSYESQRVSLPTGWFILVGVPSAALLTIAVYWSRWSQSSRATPRVLAAQSLMVSVVLFWSLNTLFFEFAWPWQEWTSRTPNQLIFSTCALSLALAAIYYAQRPAAQV